MLRLPDAYWKAGRRVFASMTRAWSGLARDGRTRCVQRPATLHQPLVAHGLHPEGMRHHAQGEQELETMTCAVLWR